MSAHARYSPSGAHGWMRCRGWRSDPTGSVHARWGTVAHDIAAQILVGDATPAEFLHCTMHEDGDAIIVNAEMLECVEHYVAFVSSIPGTRLIEQRLPVGHLTGEAGATGTADAVVLSGDELVVIDLKTGKGVRVDAEENEQLQIYALGALLEFGFLDEFQRVRMVIVQPRLDHVSEWVVSVEDLLAFGDRVKPAEEVTPGSKQCRWCARKATCPALRDEMLALVVDDVVDLDAPLAPQVAPALTRETDATTLGNLLSAVGLVEDWCRAIRGEAERRLISGEPVPGYKLVTGRRGARQWRNKDEAEQVLRSLRLKREQIYDLSLISPTTAEKLAKAGDIGPRQWAKVAEQITQADGKPSVAPETDKREAIQVGPREGVFDDLIEADNGGFPNG